ncbi:MAG: rhodanese-like domain-containing protein [Candidatus Electryonea clarkiae]|nr:rhodanese-like domain-containing protein [Candidatus Electryonea clarkiae]
MKTKIFPKLGAALLILTAFVLALMGSPTSQMPLKVTEEIGDLIIQGEDYISPGDLSEKIIVEEPGLFIADVRPAELYVTSPMANSVNIPLQTLLSREGLEEIPATGQIVLVCGNGNRSSQAWVVLRSLGYEAYILEGGMNAWVGMLEGDGLEDKTHYTARLQALRQRFLGDSAGISVAPSTTSVETTTPTMPKVKKKKKKKAAGGC